MDVQNEFRSLISQVQKFCRQEQDVISELVDSKTVTFFVKNETPKIKPLEKKIIPTTPAVAKAPAPKPQISTEPKKAEIAKPAAPKPAEPKVSPKEPEITEKKEEMSVSHTVSHTGSFLSTLPSPQPKKELPPFEDMKKMLKKLAPQLKISDRILPDDDARKKVEAWKETYPQVAFISFSQPSSPDASFIKNVADAVNTRLKSAKIYFPTQETLLELIALAQEKHLLAIFASFDLQLQMKANDYFSLISALLEAPESKESQICLTARAKLFETPIYDIKITESLQTNPQEKAGLWKQLRELIQP